MEFVHLGQVTSASWGCMFIIVSRFSFTSDSGLRPLSSFPMTILLFTLLCGRNSSVFNIVVIHHLAVIQRCMRCTLPLRTHLSLLNRVDLFSQPIIPMPTQRFHPIFDDPSHVVFSSMARPDDHKNRSQNLKKGDLCMHAKTPGQFGQFRAFRQLCDIFRFNNEGHGTPLHQEEK